MQVCVCKTHTVYNAHCAYILVIFRRTLLNENNRKINAKQKINNNKKSEN